MNKYNKVIFTFLIFSRFFDLFSTYIAGNGSLIGEMNILVRIFNLGWYSLIISEIIILLFAYFILSKQSNHYYLDSETKINDFNITFKNYFALIYFGKKISVFQMFFSNVKQKQFINSFIHVFLITIIIVSVIISINNLLVKYELYNLYSLKNTFYQRNVMNITNVIVFFIVLLIYHYKKYYSYIYGNK